MARRRANRYLAFSSYSSGELLKESDGFERAAQSVKSLRKCQSATAPPSHIANRDGLICCKFDGDVVIAAVLVHPTARLTAGRRHAEAKPSSSAALANHRRMHNDPASIRLPHRALVRVEVEKGAFRLHRLQTQFVVWRARLQQSPASQYHRLSTKREWPACQVDFRVAAAEGDGAAAYKERSQEPSHGSPLWGSCCSRQLCPLIAL